MGKSGEACLALATSAQKIEKIDIALVDREAFKNKKISVEQNPGNTLVKSLIDKHVDITSLDIHKLVSVAKLVSESVSKEKTLILH